MKNHKIVGLFLLIGLFAASVSAQSLIKRTTTKTDKFDFGAGGTLAITGAPAGSIRITGSSKNEVEITAEIQLQAASEADLDRLGQVTGVITDETIGRTGIVSVGTHNKLGDKKLWKKFPKNLIGLPFRIDYVISVPHYCDLEIDAGRGDVSVAGVEGSLRANLLESNANFEISGGTTSITVTSGSVDIAFGLRGWRGRTADVQVATGDLTVKLPVTLSAEVDALVLRGGSIENSFPGLRPRDRKATFTEKAILAKAGVGGPQMKFTVGDGKLKIEPLAPMVPTSPRIGL
jgi:hypothetical protein